MPAYAGMTAITRLAFGEVERIRWAKPTCVFDLFRLSMIFALSFPRRRESTTLKT